MTLSSLTRDGVLRAVSEFDNLGRSDFLLKYGFKKARTYFLALDEKLYDSKAIVGCALGLSAEQFSGGDDTVAKRLEELQFEVRRFPNLDWIREEIVLACAIVAENNWKQPSAHERDWRIIELSELLQTDHFHPLDQHGPDFRSPASVGRKTADIATSHPAYKGTRTRGNRLDGIILREFIAHPAEMHREAARIRAAILGREPSAATAQNRLQSREASPVVFDVPVEAHRTATFRSTNRSNDVVAVRREAELVKRYQKWNRDAGGSMSGKDILLPGRTSPLRVDLYDLSTDELIEAKGSIDRDHIRLALGQVLDYARYVEPKRRAVLVPSYPGDDLVDLLLAHGVSCIYETPAGTFLRADARSDTVRGDESIA
jgi:hypothetical protein